MRKKLKDSQVENESETFEIETVEQKEVLHESEKLYTIEDLESLKKELDDKYLRLMAEFENYKRRITKEKEDLRINTKTQMLSAVLDIDSDLAIAKKNIQVDEGINLILEKITTFLKSQGVETIQTESYDSDLHEVISVLEVGEEKIIDVISKGYSIGGKPFRYPKIILGK